MTALRDKARQLRLWSIVEHWDEYENQSWLQPFLLAEEQERARRGFNQNIRTAGIGQFKPMSEFDWSWPTKIDREHVEELFNLEFFREKSNVIFIGTNGLGKTMIAQNLAHTVLMTGTATRFIKASKMLDEIVECDGSAKRRRCLEKFCNCPLLVLDEVGYMNYDSRFADLLYEVISARYERHSTIVTTNKSFKEWNQIFPHAACAVTLVDRLLHKAESIVIQGDSFRAKEAEERKTAKAKVRQQKRKKKDGP